MVTRAEYDKAQEAWLVQSKQPESPLANVTGPGEGVQPATSLEDLIFQQEQFAAGIEAAGLGGRDPASRASMVLPGGGLVAGTLKQTGKIILVDVGRAGIFDDAARLTAQAARRAGFSLEAQKAAQAQTVQIIKGMEKSAKPIDVYKAIDKALYNAGRNVDGLDPSSAGKLAFKALKGIKINPKLPANPAVLGTKFEEYGKMLKNFGKGSAQYVLGVASALVLSDFLRGTLDLAETRANTAIEMYANGEISKEVLDKNMDDLPYDANITDAYKQRAYAERDKVDYYTELGKSIGYEKIEAETNKQFSDRVFNNLKQEQENLFAEERKQREEVIKFEEQQAQQREQNISQYMAARKAFEQRGIFTQAEANRAGVGEEFRQATQAALTPPPKKRGTLPMAGAGGQTQEKQDAAIAAEQQAQAATTAAATKQATATPSSDELFTQAPTTFTPIPKQELEKQLGVTLTQAAYNEYVRTGRLP